MPGVQRERPKEKQRTETGIEKKSEWVWSIVNFTKSLRCVSGVNKWINLSVGLWSVTPYCRVPSGARPSNLSHLFSLSHTLAFIHIKTHTLKSKLLGYSAQWKKNPGFTYAHIQNSIKPQTLVTLTHWDIDVFILLLLAPFYEHNKMCVTVILLCLKEVLSSLLHF